MTSKSPTPALPADDLLSREFSYFHNVHATKPSQTIVLRDFLRRIRSEEWSKPIAEIRSVAATGDKKTTDKLKRDNLPAVTPSGIFRHRANDGLSKHSGLLCLDSDALDERLAEVCQRLVNDPHVLTFFVSPSGHGLKVFVSVVAANPAEHLDCFRAAEAYFKEQGLVVDPACKDVSRLCFVSHDPGCWIAKTPVAPFTPPRLLSALSAPLHESASSAHSARQAAANLKRRRELEVQLNHKPRLARLYRQFVETRTAMPGTRNAFIVKLVPSLYEVVGENVLVGFALLFFDLNQAYFKDSRAQHEAETRVMLRNYATSYMSNLTAGEKSVYEELDARGQAAFRICRDLAKRGKEYMFFLSCDELAERIELDSRQAHRLLCAFVNDGVLGIISPGARRAHRQTPIATEYKWLL